MDVYLQSSLPTQNPGQNRINHSPLHTSPDNLRMIFLTQNLAMSKSLLTFATLLFSNTRLFRLYKGFSNRSFQPENSSN